MAQLCGSYLNSNYVNISGLKYQNSTSYHRIMNECVNVLNKLKEGSMPIVKAAYLNYFLFLNQNIYVGTQKNRLHGRFF